MSFDEYKEQFLRDLDEVSILEVLDISGEDLLNAFEDKLLRYREDNDEY